MKRDFAVIIGGILLSATFFTGLGIVVVKLPHYIVAGDVSSALIAEIVGFLLSTCSFVAVFYLGKYSAPPYDA